MLFRNTPRRPTHSLNEDLPPIDFNVAAFLPPESYEPGLIITAVHDVRFGSNGSYRGCRLREYQVSLHGSNDKQWIMDTKLPQSSLIDDFERNRLNIKRFNQMLDAEPDQIDYTVEVDPTKIEPPNEANNETNTQADSTLEPYVDTQHQRPTPGSERNIHRISKLLDLRSIYGDTFWFVQWSNNVPPEWELETTLRKLPSWTLAKRTFDAEHSQRSINTLRSQSKHPLPTIHEHITTDSTPAPSS